MRWDDEERVVKSVYVVVAGFGDITTEGDYADQCHCMGEGYDYMNNLYERYKVQYDYAEFYTREEYYAKFKPIGMKLRD